MEEKNTVPAAIPPAGTEDIPTRKDRRPIIIAVAAVAATVLIAGGVCGYRVYENHRVSLARQACASAVADQSKAVKSYKALLNADATTAALKTDATSVKDAKTLDVLSKAMMSSTPKAVSCKADSRDAVVTATKAVTANASWYKAHTRSLNGLVKAVETSKLDKTVDDADALYKEPDGKVAAGKTRASLLDAIKKRDADAIAKAVKEVNESKTAKEQADAEAKARAEQEAAAAAAAQQAQASQSQSYSFGSSSNRGNYSYSSSNGGGSSYAPSQSTSNGGSSSGGSSSDLHIVIGGSGVPAQNGQCRPGNTCMDGVCNTCP